MRLPGIILLNVHMRYQIWKKCFSNPLCSALDTPFKFLIQNGIIFQFKIKTVNITIYFLESTVNFFSYFLVVSLNFLFSRIVYPMSKIQTLGSRSSSKFFWIFYLLNSSKFCVDVRVVQKESLKAFCFFEFPAQTVSHMRHCQLARR